MDLEGSGIIDITEMFNISFEPVIPEIPLSQYPSINYTVYVWYLLLGSAIFVFILKHLELYCQRKDSCKCIAVSSKFINLKHCQNISSSDDIEAQVTCLCSKYKLPKKETEL